MLIEERRARGIQLMYQAFQKLQGVVVHPPSDYLVGSESDPDELSLHVVKNNNVWCYGLWLLSQDRNEGESAYIWSTGQFDQDIFPRCHVFLDQLESRLHQDLASYQTAQQRWIRGCGQFILQSMIICVLSKVAWLQQLNSNDHDEVILRMYNDAGDYIKALWSLSVQSNIDFMMDLFDQSVDQALECSIKVHEMVSSGIGFFLAGHELSRRMSAMPDKVKIALSNLKKEVPDAEQEGSDGIFHQLAQQSSLFFTLDNQSLLKSCIRDHPKKPGNVEHIDSVFHHMLLSESSQALRY